MMVGVVVVGDGRRWLGGVMVGVVMVGDGGGGCGV